MVCAPKLAGGRSCGLAMLAAVVSGDKGDPVRIRPTDLAFLRQMGLIQLVRADMPHIVASAEVTAEIRRILASDGVRSMAVGALASRIQAEFAEAGIRSLVYKGVPLSLQTTGRIGGRPPGDIDVVVHRNDVGHAHEVLSSLGWSVKWGDLPIATSRLARVTQLLTCENTYRSADKPSIDLHWRFDPNLGNLRLDFDSVWEQREVVAAGGLELTTLGRDHAALVTAVHGTRERWFRWKHLADWLRQRQTLVDMSRFRKLASSLGAGRAVAVAEILSARILREPLSVKQWQLSEHVLSHAAMGGSVGGAHTRLGLMAGVAWRWRVADTKGAAAVSVGTPPLRQGLKLVSRRTNWNKTVRIGKESLSE